MPDGEQARSAATEVEYDVVIVDLNLPQLDGVSVLRYLRSKKPSPPAGEPRLCQRATGHSSVSPPVVVPSSALKFVEPSP